MRSITNLRPGDIVELNQEYGTWPIGIPGWVIEIKSEDPVGTDLVRVRIPMMNKAYDLECFHYRLTKVGKAE